jgi:hypothetical protein
MESPQQNQGGTEQIEGEISLLDVISFLEDAWKKLVISALAGAVIGFGFWFLLGSYRAEIILNNSGGTDLVSWRSLQKSLPSLAEQMLGESKVPDDQKRMYQTLSSDEWWKKNTKATYAMSKAETKELASTAGLELAGTSIIGFVLIASDLTKQGAIDRVLQAKNFLLQGASYLAIRNLLNSQESHLINAAANISKKVNSTQVELGYQQERLKSLEALAKRFPSEQKTISQIVDIKDSGAKYLPLSTQIIAANTDINASKEALERLKDAQTQMAVLKNWVEQAVPLVANNYDGLVLSKQLLAQETILRASIDPTDLNSLGFVDDLRSILLGINAKYAKGFESNTKPVVEKKGMLKSTAGGLAAAFFLMLIVLLCQRVLVSIKRAGAGSGISRLEG